MSEYFESDGSNFVKFDKPGHLENFITMLNVYEFDFLVAFLGFFVVRYLFPNKIISKTSSIKDGLVIAFFYAIFGIIRSGMLKYKKHLDIVTVGSSYYSDY